MSDAVLSLESVRRVYHQGERELCVLNEVNLTILAGELVALIGPSGSGKSTLLHIAGLLDRPQQGAVRILGEEVAFRDDATRTRLRNRSIGFVYQFHHLLPELTALENVMLPQRIAGVAFATARERGMALLTRLGLSDRIEHFPAQLSGGEQQRVAIARALANRPALLLADEPTGNLDPETSNHVRELFLEIAREEGVAALIATHNLALADGLSRAITLKEGVLTPTRGRPQ